MSKPAASTRQPTPCKVCDDNIVQRYRKLGVCNACYASLQYWRGKSVGDLIKRDAQLTRMKKRASFMMGLRTNQVVAPLPVQQAAAERRRRA
jgi:hypothetical protein